MSDKGSINNITLPVYKKLKGEISEGLATKADKVTIESIKYKVENNSLYITMPQGVMPLRMYDNTYENFYFDYFGDTVIDNDGDTIQNSNIDFNTETNQYIITLPIDYEDLSISDMTFVNIIGSSDGVLNTYRVYYPVPSGTKLYRHQFSVSVTEALGDVEMTIISTSSTPITSYAGGPPYFNMAYETIVSAFISTDNCYLSSFTKYSNGFRVDLRKYLTVSVPQSGGSVTVYYPSPVYLTSSQTITDTVTAL